MVFLSGVVAGADEDSLAMAHPSSVIISVVCTFLFRLHKKPRERREKRAHEATCDGTVKL